MAKESGTFFDMYMADAVRQLQNLRGITLSEDQILQLREKAQAAMVDREAAIVNTYRAKTIKGTLHRILHWMLTREKRPIVTGHGTLFMPHEEYDSVNVALLEFLGASRNVAKGAMFDLMRNGIPEDDPRVKVKDQEQKNWKLLGNSWYGAEGEEGFHFFDRIMGPATTYTGQLVISHTLFGFETFACGNYWLRNRNEMARHIASCLEVGAAADPQEEWGEHPMASDVSHDKIVELLVKGSAPGWNSRDAAVELVSGLSHLQLWSLYLRGNPYLFLQFPVAQAYLDCAVSGEIHEPSAKKIEKTHPEGLAALDSLWAGMKRWTAVHWVHNDCPRWADQVHRKIVTLVDTDSNFLDLHPWINFIKESYGIEELEDADYLTSMNIFIYLLNRLNDMQMANLTKAMQVPEARRSRINFKNEFIIARLILTAGKKNYVALQMFKEGIRLPGGKIDLKGLAVKKTTVSRSTGSFFTDSIEHRMLRSKKIDRTGVINDIVELENRVFDAIKSMDTEYATPASIGRVKDYANPMSQNTVRGMIFWNEIEVSNPIREGDRVSMFRLKIGADATKLQRVIDEQLAAGNSENVAVYEKLMEIVFGSNADPEISTNGLNWIALPRELKKMPEWVPPLIDIENVVAANVSPILPLLDAIGIITMRDTYSNTIPF